MDTATYAGLLACALGAVVFGAYGGRPVWVQLAAFALGSLAGFASAAALPTAAWGLIVGLVSAGMLWRGHWTLVAPVAAGLVATGAGWMLAPFSGLAPGWALGAAAYLFSLWMARRPGFVSDGMRDEALSFTCLLGLAAAALPGIAAGWQSAIALNVAPGRAAALPGWVVAAGCISAALGAVYRFWRRAS